MQNEAGLNVAEKVRQSLELLLSSSVLEVVCAAANLGRCSAFRFSDRTMAHYAWVTQDSCTGDILVWLASRDRHEVRYSESESAPLPRCHHESFPMIKEGHGYARNVNFDKSMDAAECILLFLTSGVRPELKVYTDAPSHVD